MGKRRRATTARTNTNIAVIGGVAAVVVLGAGAGAFALFGGGEDGGGSGSSASSDDKPHVKTGPLSTTEVRTASREFLTAWAAGKLSRAAAHTDDAKTAEAALTSFPKDAHLGALKVTPGKLSDGGTGGRTAKAPFTVATTVAYKGRSKPLSYGSELTVVRNAEDGKPLVKWASSVLHPELRDGDRLVTGASGTPPIKAVDRDGAELTAAKYPSLGTVLDGLREKFGKKAGGTPGIETRVIRKDSKAAKSGKGDAKALPDKTLLTLAKGTPGTLHTTLSAKAQSAAERSVAKRQRASVVVLKPSTGEILAAANSRPSGFNTAFQGSIAPGSTMKIVTSSLLIEKKLAGIDKKHPCPKYVTYGGWKFQNDDKFEIKDGTFRASFARSCNTAFISQAEKLKNDDLTRQAQDVFGLGRGNWSIGVPSFDGAVPVQSDAQMAASLIGQGAVRMNPLNMASVVATAETGTFRQPYLVSPDLDDRKLATASRKLSPATVKQLRDLMHYTAVAGTAVKPMSGLGSDMGAKTGSAEVDGQKKPNGWFTAWRGDLASAAVVQEGGHGGDSAGPIVREMLLAGG
ncbi:penicillin-binding transpeptidase domain-containing protein [Streptomyces sp. NPDC059009]|uniref:penicillin-binding transpeptidase domain-containing protein n=1 Tax=Streptomyces sp. NPDC059009 TaxID=3346694 RepID=UPI0036C345F5